MAIAPYRRVAVWRPALALARIADKAEACRVRLERIASEMSDLLAERAEIEAILAFLEVERAREVERSLKRARPAKAEDLPHLEEDQASDPGGMVAPEPKVDDVDYDPALRLFRSPGASRADPRSARAVIPASDDADPGLDRLLRLVSTPGAMHVSLVGEAAQRQFGDTFKVPPASCSVPLGPFFVDDTLSMSVLQDLVKPEKAGPVLTKLLGEASPRDGAGDPDPTG